MSDLLQIANAQVLLNILIQITLFAGAVILVLRFVRRSAALRYGIAYSGLLCLIFITFLSLALQRQGQTWMAMPVDVSFLKRLNFGELQLNAQPDRSAAFQFASPMPGELDFDASTGVDSNAGAASRLADSLRKSPLSTSLILLWATGMLVGLFGLLRAALGLRRLANTSEVLNAQQKTMVSGALKNLHVDEKPVTVRLSHAVSCPVQIGYFNARILLPSPIMTQMTPQRLEAVLVHELAHWRRRDNIANLLQLFILTVFWFHPLAHRLSKIASRAREEICDNYVLVTHDALNYSETLLWINSLQLNQSTCKPSPVTALAVGIANQDWNLEQRIKELIDENRETTMTLSRKSAVGIRLISLCCSVMLASSLIIPITNQTYAQQPPADQTGAGTQPVQSTRDAPPANKSETLSPEVFAAIEEIQNYLKPEANPSERDMETAKNLLDALYADKYATANSFEQSTILNFYTNYYLYQKDYHEATRVFEQMLTIDALREDVNLRVLRSLGQLYAVSEQWQESIDAYKRWLALTNQDDKVVYKGLSYAHYQLEQLQPALDFWMRHWNMIDSDELTRDDYAYRNGLYFTLGQYEEALELTKEMILRFNNQTDWDNLAAIHNQLKDIKTIEELSAGLGGTLNFSVPEPEIAFATVIPTDGDYLPLVAVAPMYPKVAADEGIEGWVLLKFTVNEYGAVVENSITIEDADPPEVFNANSMRAAGQFKFQPRMVAGEGVAVPDVQYLFRFKLRNDDV